MSDKGSIQLLILETDLLLSSRLCEILKAQSQLKLFRIKGASTLREAYQAMEKSKPDLILMDVYPRDDPDFVFFKRLHHEVPSIPILVLLEEADQTYALKLMYAGAQNTLLKRHLEEDTLPAFLLRTLEKHVSQKAIQESEERFRLMIENSSDLLTTLEPGGVVSYTGPSTEHILCYRNSEMTGKNFLDFIHRDDRKPFLDLFNKSFETDTPFPRFQFRIRHREGYWLHMEGKGRIVTEALGRKICILNSHDVSHRVKLENRLMSLSLRDELTGLQNRRSFLAVFEQQLKLAQRSKKEEVYLLFIDLDRFKWINDHLGHNVGDQVLVAAAQILKTTFRDADVVARLGGDEFVVLLTNETKKNNIEGLKSRLSINVEAWNHKEVRPFQLAMSVGILFHDPHQLTSIEELMLKADELMYEQKRAKKEKQNRPPSLKLRRASPNVLIEDSGAKEKIIN